MDSLFDSAPIRVLCRLRPANSSESYLPFLLHDDGASISIADRHFTFDRVFGPEASQGKVYRDGVSAIVNDVLRGYNGTIFAYGQTASGKTHTMEGEFYTDNADRSLAGITPRILTDVFKHIDELSSDIQANLKISYFEIYMDKVRDLLDVSKVNLPVHEDKNRVPYVKGVTELQVECIEEVLELLCKGRCNRSVSVTNMNEHSSRSHSIVSLQLSQMNSQSEKTLHGKLYLVDLAGSEKVSKSGAKGITLREAKRINKSLSALGNVISALADGNKNHVPYRDSKLTRILQQSLGGNSRTSIFVCCSPSAASEAETKSTLMFGQRAKTITNEIQVNEELTADEWKKRYLKEKENNARLRTKLAQYELTRDTTVSYTSPDVVPGSSASPPSSHADTVLNRYSSMPSLPTGGVLSEACHECVRYQHDLSSLCQQLDDKDDELAERSRDILSLERELSDVKKNMDILTENNSLLIADHKEIESKYTSGQEEIKAIMAALEELSESYEEKDMQHSQQCKENSENREQIACLEDALTSTKHELSNVKVMLEENRHKTVGMFLDLFNDFSDVTLSSKLRAAADMYRSNPCLSLKRSASVSSHLLPTGSDRSSVMHLSDSGYAGSSMASSLCCGSSLDLSQPPARDSISQSMFDLRPTAHSESASSSYHGSKVFQQRVGDLRDRLSVLLEGSYSKVISPPSDTSSSYVRNIRLRKLKPLGGGRVFTVFSRAARKQGKYGCTEDIMPMQLGRHA